MDGGSCHCTGGSDQEKKCKRKEKKCKKAKWLSEEALKITEKRKDAKRKIEKEKYTHLNAEFRRKAGEIRKLSSVINAKK